MLLGAGVPAIARPETDASSVSANGRRLHPIAYGERALMRHAGGVVADLGNLDAVAWSRSCRETLALSSPVMTMITDHSRLDRRSREVGPFCR
jgi:hypothetical protein